MRAPRDQGEQLPQQNNMSGLHTLPPRGDLLPYNPPRTHPLTNVPLKAILSVYLRAPKTQTDTKQ